MGNVRSSYFENENDNDDIWWPQNENNMTTSCECQNCAKFNSVHIEPELCELSSTQLKKEDFKFKLIKLSEERKQILQNKHQEMNELRKELSKLKEENELLRKSKFCDCEVLKKENEELKHLLDEQAALLGQSEKITENNRKLKINVADMQKEIQDLNKEILDFDKERQEYKAHVAALKDVISLSKNMLEIRETQLKELKQKVENIERSLAEKEINILSQDLRHQYEIELENMRNLRALYQERSRIEKLEREQLCAHLENARKDLETEKSQTNDLNERIVSLDEVNSQNYDKIKQLESNLGLTKAESRQYQAELTVINQLFSEVLLGFNNSPPMNLDKLQKYLEDHHDLLQNMVINEESEVSYALPKMLLDLLHEIEEEKEFCNTESQTSPSNKMYTVEEIVETLPKVWKILIELLSQQIAPPRHAENSCYKTIETAKGSSFVLSVSQTFIRLKDLILEKKSLEKETTHLKHLNCHLENRLQDQQKKLEQVQNELTKTWHFVGKLQKQHHMLHTQAKILKYELTEKRKLLTGLKEELEDSREKCVLAKEKNADTEEQWKLLRTEFLSRREMTVNDSAESGYSDEEPDTSECVAGTSNKSLEEILAERDVRLKRMEGQTNRLVNQVYDLTNKSNCISNKLDDLHETYGISSNNKTTQDDDEEDNTAC